MAVIIIKGTKPRYEVEFGVDIRVDPVGSDTDSDFVEKNSGPDKYFPGGPMCHFRGKDVPAMIRWHESGSITSDLLTDALKTMDHYELFPRNDPTIKPFMLLDGHGSRLELPFIQYINTPADHWVVCLGVPYGTALWQVGDSKEQNGSFNIAMTKEKDNLLQYKEHLSMAGTLEPTDMLPLINRAWKRSFARVGKNKHAIAERGWMPYNRNIMKFSEIRQTMTAEEIRQEQICNDVILPSNDCNNGDSSAASDNSTHVSSTTTMASTDISLQAPINDVNITKGCASFCITSILQHKDMLHAREEIQKNQNQGLELRDRLKKSKKLTAGVLYKNGAARIGATTLEILKENKQDQIIKEQRKLRKEQTAYLKLKEEADKVLSSGTELEKMTIKDLKTLVKLHKLRSDGAMPTKKEDLIDKYKQWKDRPPPQFNINSNASMFVENVENNLSDDESESNEIANMAAI